MTYRMIFIATTAIVFAWGFSALVENRQPPMQPDSTYIACSGWSGDNCTRNNIR